LVAINASDFPLGGWLYVDLAAGSDYSAQEQADDSFVKKYADMHETLLAAAGRYADEVTAGRYPDAQHSYS